MRIARPILSLLLVLVALPGCSSCRRMIEGMGPPLVEVSQQDASFLVGIEGPWWAAEPVVLHPVRLRDGAIEPGEAIEVDRPDSGLVPATSVHGQILYLARGSEVERRRPFASPAAADARKVQGQPASLLGSEGGCFVGLEGRVDYVDFTGSTPELMMLHEDLSLAKPVDFIVPMDGGLVAVDDEVVPRYAFVFHLHPDQPAVHRFTAELPSGPNETYSDVVVVDDDLFITATFGVITGPGNTLYRWPIRKSSDAESGEQLEEFKPEHKPGLTPTLLAGSAFTHWNGLGVLGDHLFIGAGRRGVLLGPVDGKPDRLHDVDGWCLDLLVLGERLVVLVADGEQDPGTHRVSGARQIVVLSWDAGRETLVEEARHDLDLALDALAI
jgi:hypothetical protein